MITSYENANAVGNVDIPLPFFEMIHNISMYLLLDDKHDLGRFSYYNRSDHWYHGNNNIHHPGIFHHWQIGILGLLFSSVGSLLVKGKEIYESFKKIESGDLSGIDDSLISSLETDNTISLEEYNNEISGIDKITPLTLTPSPKPRDKKLILKTNLPT
jgi:hypothetical protein